MVVAGWVAHSLCELGDQLPQCSFSPQDQSQRPVSFTLVVDGEDAVEAEDSP